MRFDLLLNELARDATCAKRLQVYGPSAWRPFVHITDAVAALVQCLELPTTSTAGQVFNVVEANYRKRELAELILREVRDATIEYIEGRPDPRDYRVSGAKWHGLARPADFRTAPAGIREIVGALRSGTFGDPFSPAYRNVP